MKLNIGTYNGVRYTRITLDLANPRVYAMLHKILRAEIGDKIRLFNIPKDHGPGPVDVLIQGYEEIISPDEWRSEEHTSELQSLMRISYAVFCLKKKKK